jgi:hypothetical protein
MSCSALPHPPHHDGLKPLKLWTKIYVSVFIYLFVCLFIYLFIYFCNPGAWTQGLHLEPLWQSFFCVGFFQDRVLWIICLGWQIVLLSSWSLPPE